MIPVASQVRVNGRHHRALPLPFDPDPETTVAHGSPPVKQWTGAHNLKVSLPLPETAREITDALTLMAKARRGRVRRRHCRT